MTETPNPNIIDADTLTGDLKPIRRVVLSIGSNVGERFASLQGAVSSLADTPDVHVVAVSPVYEADPVDAPEGSRDFLNAVLLVETTLSSHTMLERAHAVEDAFGRVRGERGAPRTLDVDLVLIGDRVSDDATLTLPHPRAHQRAFVLVPWNEVDPKAEIPGKGKVAELLGEVDVRAVRRRDDLVLDVQ